MTTNGGATASTVACSACGRKFKWKESLAGKTVNCPCGHPIAFPGGSVASRPAAARPVVRPAAAPASPSAALPAPVRARVAPPVPPRSAAAPAAAVQKPVAKSPAIVFDDEPSDGYDLAPLPGARGAQGGVAPPAAQLLAPVSVNVCPKCSAMMDAGAVLCMRCGFNSKTGKALKTSVKTGPGIGDMAVAAASAAGAAGGKVVAGLITGGIAAIGCGVAWGLIAINTGYEVGWVAWGIGVVTGFAIMIVNPSGGTMAGVAGAFFALVGLGIGKFMEMQHFPIEVVWGPIDALWAALAVGSAFRLASGFSKESE